MPRQAKEPSLCIGVRLPTRLLKMIEDVGEKLGLSGIHLDRSQTIRFILERAIPEFMKDTDLKLSATEDQFSGPESKTKVIKGALVERKKLPFKTKQK